jgi:hypothetical protein
MIDAPKVYLFIDQFCVDDSQLNGEVSCRLLTNKSLFVCGQADCRRRRSIIRDPSPFSLVPAFLRVCRWLPAFSGVVALNFGGKKKNRIFYTPELVLVGTHQDTIFLSSSSRVPHLQEFLSSSRWFFFLLSSLLHPSLLQTPLRNECDVKN